MLLNSDENVFLKVDRALSKIITLLISNKKECNHFFKRNEARNPEREARHENVRAERADFFRYNPVLPVFLIISKI